MKGIKKLFFGLLLLTIVTFIFQEKAQASSFNATAVDDIMTVDGFSLPSVADDVDVTLSLDMKINNHEVTIGEFQHAAGDGVDTWSFTADPDGIGLAFDSSSTATGNASVSLPSAELENFRTQFETSMSTSTKKNGNFDVTFALKNGTSTVATPSKVTIGACSNFIAAGQTNVDLSTVSKEVIDPASGGSPWKFVGETYKVQFVDTTETLICDNQLRYEITWDNKNVAGEGTPSGNGTHIYTLTVTAGKETVGPNKYNYTFDKVLSVSFADGINAAGTEFDKYVAVGQESNPRTVVVYSTMGNSINLDSSWDYSDVSWSSSPALSPALTSSSTITVTPSMARTYTIKPTVAGGLGKTDYVGDGIRFTAKNALTSFKINPTTLSLPQGATGSVEAVSTGGSIDGYVIDYYSEEVSVATVAAGGLITAKSQGTAVIAADATPTYIEGATTISSTNSCAVTVGAPSNPSQKIKTISLMEDEEVTYAKEALISNLLSTDEITWTIAKTSIADIDADINSLTIEGVANGSTTLTATVKRSGATVGTFKYTVTVYDGPSAVLGTDNTIKVTLPSQFYGEDDDGHDVEESKITGFDIWLGYNGTPILKVKTYEKCMSSSKNAQNTYTVPASFLQSVVATKAVQDMLGNGSTSVLLDIYVFPYGKDHGAIDLDICDDSVTLYKVILGGSGIAGTTSSSSYSSEGFTYQVDLNGQTDSRAYVYGLKGQTFSIKAVGNNVTFSKWGGASTSTSNPLSYAVTNSTSQVLYALHTVSSNSSSSNKTTSSSSSKPATNSDGTGSNSGAAGDKNGYDDVPKTGESKADIWILWSVLLASILGAAFMIYKRFGLVRAIANVEAEEAAEERARAEAAATKEKEDKLKLLNDLRNLK